MRRAVEIDELIGEVGLVARTGFVSDRPGNDGPAGSAEDADGARHMRGRGDKKPNLARLRVDEPLAEDRVIVSVARLALEDHAPLVDSQIGEQRRGGVRFGRLIGKDRSRARGEDELRGRIEPGEYDKACDALGVRVQAWHAT